MQSQSNMDKKELTAQGSGAHSHLGHTPWRNPKGHSTELGQALPHSIEAKTKDIGIY